MNYYLMFEKFEENEGSFTVQEPWDMELFFSPPKLMKCKAYITVDECYDARGMSDFLKVGLGMLASPKVQQVFFEQGFSGVQFVPVEVKNGKPVPGFAFINATAYYDLLDPEASEASSFKPKYGEYFHVYEEMMDKDKFDKSDIQHDCFSLPNYKTHYFASERVKHAIEAAGITGVEFIPMKFASIDSV